MVMFLMVYYTTPERNACYFIEALSPKNKHEKSVHTPVNYMPSFKKKLWNIKVQVKHFMKHKMTTNAILYPVLHFSASEYLFTHT